MGPLNYEVNIDGYTRQAHIDHMLPCPRTSGRNSPDDLSSHQDEGSHQDDDDIMPIVDSEPCEASTDATELVTLGPHRNCQPPKHLIKEID